MKKERKSRYFFVGMEIFCIFARSISVILSRDIAWTLLLESVIDALFLANWNLGNFIAGQEQC